MNYLQTLILIFLASQIGYSKDSFEISGKVISNENDSPIAYATIIETSTFEWTTTTDEKGGFVLKIGVIQMDSVWLKIESLGYRDTIIGVNPDKDLPLLIRLSPHTYVLPQVNVSGSPLKEKVLGIPQGQVLKDKDGNDRGLLPSNSAGLSSRAFVKIKDRGTGILKSIEFYLIPKGFPETPFILRILEARQDIEPNRMYSPDQFIDVMKEPIIVKGHVGSSLILAVCGLPNSS